jgi:hypothetical protein
MKNELFLINLISVGGKFFFSFIVFFFVRIETLSVDFLDAYDVEYECISQLYEERKRALDA